MTTKPARRRACVALIAALLLVGCGTVEDAPVPAAVSVPAPRPDGVIEQPAATDDEGPQDCEPRASFRPGTTPADGPALARIRARGLLRVGGQQTYNLLSYRDPVTGEMSGFEVDLARLIAKALLGDPNKIQFVALTVAQREPAASSGQVDIVLASMTMTCQRWQQIAFSAEYLRSGQRVLVDRRSTATRLEDLAGRRACAAAGSTNLRPIARAGLVPVAANNATDCMVLLQQGQVDAVSTSDAILAGLAAQDRSTHIIGPRLSEAPIGAAMQPGAEDLIRFVNGVLEQVRASGEWDRLYRTWLEPALGPAQAPVPLYRD